MLKLPNDGPATGRLLSHVLTGDGPAAIVRAIAEAQPPLMQRLGAGRLHGDPTEIVGVNDTGDKQKALDVGAHHHMIAVLRDAGNMSAPTVLFVLERVLAQGARGRLMLAALGPGFTLSAIPLDV